MLQLSDVSFQTGRSEKDKSPHLVDLISSTLNKLLALRAAAGGGEVLLFHFPAVRGCSLSTVCFGTRPILLDL